MRTEIQAVAGANNFTGTAGAGLVTFTNLPLPAGDPSAGPVVTAIALENGYIAIGTVLCYFKRAADALGTLNRITVLNESNIPGFSKAGCRIPVPRFVVGTPGVFTPWELVLITTGKTVDANFVVSYELGESVHP